MLLSTYMHIHIIVYVLLFDVTSLVRKQGTCGDNKVVVVIMHKEIIYYTFYCYIKFKKVFPLQTMSTLILFIERFAFYKAHLDKCL